MVKPSIFCKYCKLRYTSIVEYRKHEVSKKHGKAIKKHFENIVAEVFKAIQQQQNK